MVIRSEVGSHWIGSYGVGKSGVNTRWTELEGFHAVSVKNYQNLKEKMDEKMFTKSIMKMNEKNV